MDYTCIIGNSSMENFTAVWEGHLPAWMVIYCESGEAELSLQFKSYVFRVGMMAIVLPDMYTNFLFRSGDFRAFYCLVDGKFADQVSYGMPNDFYDVFYTEPLLQADKSLRIWMDVLRFVAGEKDNPYRKDILSNALRSLFLSYFNLWQRVYGNRSSKREMNHAEIICMKFYNLVFNHFREHRDTAFYAGQLCITPCYLAMVMRRICRESPKQAIDRQVTLEMKYMLRNTALTAKQIALRLNFPDTSYMCRFFRKQTGFSLSEYRKNDIGQ